MTPEFVPEQLKKTKAWEYLVRFFFGGAITVGTGIIATLWGPVVAGFFLAFPAILPASITLVKHHDGRAQAVEDARGARLGTVGLATFAVVVAMTAGRLPPLAVLTLASLSWAVVDIGLWFVRFGTSRRHA